MIYLDNSATTKPYKEVLNTFLAVSENYFGNPSSLHSKGMEAEELIEKAREQIGKLLDASPGEIVFTSGGTEGNNLAIKGATTAYKNRGKHVITTTIEHPASMEAFKYLEETGFDVTYLPVNSQGLVSLEDLKNAIREDTIFVSIIHVNNEIGTVQNIEEIGELIKRYPKVLFHVDHVQGASKVPLSIRKANIDLCTISGHKLHGVKGTGVLTVREGVRLSPLFHGGGQEKGYRSGTENVAGIVSLAKAMRLCYEKASEGILELEALKGYTMEELEKIKGIILNTPKEHSAPHIINFSVPGCKPEVLIHALSEKGIYVSTKSACSSKQSEASHVILAIGAGEESAKTAIRISFSFETDKEQAEQFLIVLRNIIHEQRKWIG
ncbi:cysteine desulfurase NifS [Pueribacillus theae]|uniref:Cysteine desulfurase NifS n=1 Tax=Pueribacillus theae TaxID=2171751 RepID=A0A2U1K2F9_9BACI|nr:cysteine desulfurase family protein [Pueribacillus theae]PWA11148.1 cysteine desulfurase NifS [Pueribacillus theae]